MKAWISRSGIRVRRKVAPWWIKLGLEEEKRELKDINLLR